MLIAAVSRPQREGVVGDVRRPRLISDGTGVAGGLGVQRQTFPRSRVLCGLSTCSPQPFGAYEYRPATDLLDGP